MKIADVRLVEVFASDDGRRAVSLRFITDCTKANFQTIGCDVVFPADAKQLAETLRKVAADLEGI
jgi:hypothetical protein